MYCLLWEQKQCFFETQCVDEILSLLQEPTTKKICAVSNMTVSADSSPDAAKKGILVQVCSKHTFILYFHM